MVLLFVREGTLSDFVIDDGKREREREIGVPNPHGQKLRHAVQNAIWGAILQNEAVASDGPKNKK